MFKVIDGTEGKYSVSPSGDIKGKRGLLKPFLVQGYLAVCFRVGGRQRNLYVHRLVAEAFLPNPDNLPQINHKDEDKTNPHIDNLEWCTEQYNVEYSCAKSYSVTSPSGCKEEVFNLASYCRENNLNYKRLHEVSTGLRSDYLGWKVELN